MQWLVFTSKIPLALLGSAFLPSVAIRVADGIRLLYYFSAPVLTVIESVNQMAERNYNFPTTNQ